jgi:hypothetical protein
VTVPPFEETVQFVMVDTETLTGEQNQFPGWANVPALYYPPPAGGNFGRKKRSSRHRRLHDFDVHNAPPISELQWAWVEHTIGNSTADWIVVVGNDPVWSVGAHGPSWPLTERLLPMMEEAGVALYISGRDPIAQHLVSVPSGSVDFVGIGNGANSNASMAQEVPSLLMCPYGALTFVYGETTGFMMAEITSPSGNQVPQLTVTFYDSSGNALYNFTKTNPRASKGFTVVGTNSQRTLTIMGAMFVAAATLLCGLALFSYIQSAATKRAAFSAARAVAGGGAARKGETTPLLSKPHGSRRAQTVDVKAVLANL